MGAPSSDSAGIRQTIRALRAAGYTLANVQDGEENIPVSNEAEAMDAIMAVDDAFLVVNITPERQGWVRFVLGNAPEEVICDHTVNLSSVIEPLTDSWWG